MDAINYKVEENNRLKIRFVKDYNLPINLFDSDLWEYYMKLYDFFPTDTWHKLINTIKSDYDGNVEKWLDYCAQVRDSIIFSILESPEYKEFNNMDLKAYNLDNKFEEKNLFIETSDGHLFISIDLKKANFQALKYIGILSNETYEDFVAFHGGDDYIANSKYLRQVVFGKLNPSRQIKVEKYLINQIHNLISDKLREHGFGLYSFHSDEVIYYGEDASANPEHIINEIPDLVKEKLNLEVRADYIEVSKIPIINYRGNSIDAYERFNMITGESCLKKVSTLFFPQVYKLWKGKSITDKDLYFYAENQRAKFVNPLKYIEYL